ncbi:MAG TPA: haloacid dehalogenase type II [Pedococcus sp.]|nr:haloacid dehalogenase type II [Pedococcus sp.]
MNHASAEVLLPGGADAPDPQRGPTDTGGLHRPDLIIFDVNETLSDMSGLAGRFTELGLPHLVAATWFAGLLRDGFALTVTGQNPPFAEVASEALRGLLEAHGVPDVEAGVERIMDAFMVLPPHPDVVEGVQLLSDSGIRLVTLSNGSTAVAEGLFERSGIRDRFERMLSVQDASAWKPASAAYRYALDVCDAEEQDSMLVAVHPWDVHGAHRAGLSTAFINRAGVRYPQFFAQPDVQAESLIELAHILTGEHRP